MVMVICVGESGLMGRNHFSVCVCVWGGAWTENFWSVEWSALIPPHLSNICRLGNHQIFRAYFMAQKIH